MDMIDELLGSYQGCVKDVLRHTQENRRALSLELIAPVNFTKKERKRIPASVLDQVVHLNGLDVELYSHAQFLFAKQQNALERGLHENFFEAHGGKLLHVSSEQMNVAEQQESPWKRLQQSFSIYVTGFAILLTLSGFMLFSHVLRRTTPARERTSVCVLHPLFVKVHEKI